MKKSKPLVISYTGIPISSKSSVKYYLGVDLDESLSGKKVAWEVISKANSKLKYLFRQSKLQFSLHDQKNFYRPTASSLIQCTFDCSCSWWLRSLSKQIKTRLQTTQNKHIRYFLGLGSRLHLDSTHFKPINWLPVEQIVQQIILNHISHKKWTGT